MARIAYTEGIGPAFAEKLGKPACVPLRLY